MDITTLGWINMLAILVTLTLDLMLTYAGLSSMLRLEQEASKILATARTSLGVIATKCSQR